jgi:hypothetical protein
VVNANTLRKLIVEWIVDRRHPFNEVEAQSFRRIIEYLDSTAVCKLPKDSETIRSDAIRYFNKAKTTIKEMLSTAKEMIHLSFDLWTSLNHNHMISITAHRTSSEYTIKAMLVAIREIHESYTGKNIAETVYLVAVEFEIVEKLRYFIMDGAGNNDTTIKNLDIQI